MKGQLLVLEKFVNLKYKVNTTRLLGKFLKHFIT